MACEMSILDYVKRMGVHNALIPLGALRNLLHYLTFCLS